MGGAPQDHPVFQDSLQILVKSGFLEVQPIPARVSSRWSSRRSTADLPHPVVFPSGCGIGRNTAPRRLSSSDAETKAQTSYLSMGRNGAPSGGLRLRTALQGMPGRL